MKRVATIDEYIAQYPPDVAERLEAIRKLVHEIAPNSGEKISYGMPAFKRQRYIVFFGAFKHHIGFYPHTATVQKTCRQELSEYKTSKGAIQFPFDKPLPLQLLRKIITLRVQEEAEAANP